MSADVRKQALRRDFWFASALIVAGLAMAGFSLNELKARNAQQLAQATPPLQGQPPVENTAPAESKPGGTRPTTPAPEPARPNPQAQSDVTKPALPPAPAEKVAPPIQEK